MGTFYKVKDCGYAAVFSPPSLVKEWTKHLTIGLQGHKHTQPDNRDLPLQPVTTATIHQKDMIVNEC